MSDLVLYTTPGCHLCEQAKTLLWPVMERHSLRLKEVDVAETDTLIEQYGLRIPVVALPGQELSWPFAAEELEQWVVTAMNR